MTKALGGFTLLEMLMVCAVVAMLLSIGIINFQRLKNNLELRQAQQVLVQTLNRARSEARSSSQDQHITWTSGSITVGEKTTMLEGVELIKIKGGNDLTFTAPYGRLKVTNYLFELRRGNLKREVHVYGVTGKVKAIGF